MRALETFAIYVTPFLLIIGIAAKLLMKRRGVDLSDIQPTHFKLVISSRIAKTLGLTNPQPLLVTANEVIE